MDYCAPLGIPHSQFLQWSEQDRSKAISYTVWKAKFCEGCGTEPSTWLDDEGKYLEPPPFVAVTHRCMGCATVEDERATLPKSAGLSYKTHLRKATLEDVEQWQMKPSL
jgi:hypothetical protein